MSMKYNISKCFPANSEECYNILSNAFQLLLYKTNSSLFSTMIHGLLYHIQPSSANVSTKVKCHIGEVSTNIYCGMNFIFTKCVYIYH